MLKDLCIFFFFNSTIRKLFQVVLLNWKNAVRMQDEKKKINNEEETEKYYSCFLVTQMIEANVFL